MTEPHHGVGDAIEVHTMSNDSWCGGFEIAEVVPGGYRVRRLHDRALLPNTTSVTKHPRRSRPVACSPTRSL